VCTYGEDTARGAEAVADEARAEPEGEAVGAVGEEEDDGHADRQHVVLFHRDPSTFFKCLFIAGYKDAFITLCVCAV